MKVGITTLIEGNKKQILHRVKLLSFCIKQVKTVSIKPQY